MKKVEVFSLVVTIIDGITAALNLLAGGIVMLALILSSASVSTMENWFDGSDIYRDAEAFITGAVLVIFVVAAILILINCGLFGTSFIIGIKSASNKQKLKNSSPLLYFKSYKKDGIWKVIVNSIAAYDIGTAVMGEFSQLYNGGEGVAEWFMMFIVFAVFAACLGLSIAQLVITSKEKKAFLNPQLGQAPQYGQPQQYGQAQASQYGQAAQVQAPQYSQSQAQPYTTSVQAQSQVTPYGQAQQYGQPQQYGQTQAPQYSQAQQYGQAPQYSQAQAPQVQAPQYGQPQQYGQAQQYDQAQAAQYGQPQAPQPQASQYGQPTQYR